MFLVKLYHVAYLGGIERGFLVTTYGQFYNIQVCLLFFFTVYEGQFSAYKICESFYI